MLNQKSFLVFNNKKEKELKRLIPLKFMIQALILKHISILKSQLGYKIKVKCIKKKGFEVESCMYEEDKKEIC